MGWKETRKNIRLLKTALSTNERIYDKVVSDIVRTLYAINVDKERITELMKLGSKKRQSRELKMVCNMLKKARRDLKVYEESSRVCKMQRVLLTRQLQRWQKSLRYLKEYSKEESK